jgi:von Willebrand factor type A domain
MRFESLAWLIFAPLFAGAVIWFPPLRTWRRLVCLGLLVLTLVQPQLRRLDSGLELAVLVDLSASAADALAPRINEMQALLERSKSGDDGLFYVDYAELAQVRGEADDIPTHKRQQTRTALAIQFALSRLSPERSGRLLLITDGYSTEPLTGIEERLARQGVALDYRLVSLPSAADYRIDHLDFPLRAQVGEPFLIDVQIAGDPDGPVSIEILRDGVPIGRAKADVQRGRAAVHFSDRLAHAGAHRYTAQLSAANDTRPGNNRAEKWIEITGGPRVLLVSLYAGNPLGNALAGQGFEVETVDNPANLQVGMLSGARAVILDNTPAFRLPHDFLAGLDFYVRSQGGGLLMIGGKNSFGAGGYFESAVDDLLPVSMESRSERRKLAVAMSIVLDRSGSMAASVAGNLQKMDLANEGAARSIELLGPMDAVSVFAVDTEAHVVVPLTTLEANRQPLINAVRRIDSGGGGIYVPTGLRAAHEQLLKATVGQRHVLLFADANDATEELGDYPTLIKAMVKDGITISVIGLGTDKDSGAKFLQEVAELGQGRIFFNADATELPAVFAQETVAMARSTFVDTPAKITPAAGWMEMTARPLPWLEAIDGYNLSYLKPLATAAAFTADDNKAPLISFWQRGAGRVGAVAFPLGGDYSQRVRAWKSYGDFIQTIGRWVSGDALPPGLGLRTRLDGALLQLDLFYDASWEQTFGETAPRVMLGDGADGKARDLVWERLEPGHFSTSAPLEPDQWVRGAIQAGKHTLAFGPIMAGSNIEWTFDPARLAELQAVSHASGGIERIDLSSVWQAPHRAEFRDLRPWLLIALALLFVADALCARLGR